MLQCRLCVVREKDEWEQERERTAALLYDFVCACQWSVWEPQNYSSSYTAKTLWHCQVPGWETSCCFRGPLDLYNMDTDFSGHCAAQVEVRLSSSKKKKISILTGVQFSQVICLFLHESISKDWNQWFNLGNIERIK